MRKVADSCRDEIMFFCSDNKGDRTKRGDQSVKSEIFSKATSPPGVMI